MSKVHDTPSDVSAEDGVVLVDGPGGIALSLTPEAAEETSGRLLDGATEASGQRHFGEVGNDPVEGQPGEGEAAD